MEKLIFRSEVWRIIATGHPFDLDIVTADRRRGTGGKYLQLKGWRKLTAETARAVKLTSGTLPHEPAKDLAHHTNRTFIAFNPAARQAHPITVHYRLMQSFNGKKIING